MLMTKENKTKNILLLLFIAMSVIMGIMNKSYMVTGMYAVTLLVIGYFFREDSLYDLFYGVFMIMYYMYQVLKMHIYFI